MITSETKVDSKEGIEHLFKWAKAHSIVLGMAHERIALKYGVSTEGVIISRPIPAFPASEPTE